VALAVRSASGPPGTPYACGSPDDSEVLHVLRVAERPGWTFMDTADARRGRPR